MIEWKGTLINPDEIELVKHERHYDDVYDVAYGGGTMCAYIFMRHRKSALIFACSAAEFEILKNNIKAARKEHS